MDIEQGPHSRIAYRNGLEHFALQLFDALWRIYRQKVTYVQVYERLIEQAGATFVNDHIAFRSFATQQPLLGVASLSRIFQAVGYRAAGCYHFPDQHLAAIHFQHPRAEFPKLFLSELLTWQLSPPLRERIESTMRSHRPHISSRTLARIARLADSSHYETDDCLEQLINFFTQLPWEIPASDLLGMAALESQYAAWVLVHGYQVNHFTSLINSHGAGGLDTIEKTVAALRDAAVPMKDDIEGEPGSSLRQSATGAVEMPVTVLDHDHPAQVDWTYAYFELAERGTVIDPVTGVSARFEGFLGPQAAQLFEMTRR